MDIDRLAEELGWVCGVDYPEWGHTDVYLKTISKGYCLPNETPKDAYNRVCTTIANRLKKPELAKTFFKYVWNGWLCLATPVLANTGTDRGLPISCFGIDIGDSILDIGSKNLELMVLAKHGGGVGLCHNQIRHAGMPITDNGTSDGIIPFIKINDSTILATNQGAVRRGASSSNINIEHGDFWDWLEIREPKGDINRQCLNMNQCVVIGDKFMRKLMTGDKDARLRYSAVLRKRRQTGQPYIMYKGNVNKQNPDAYKKNGLKVYMTNICVTGDTLINIKIDDEIFICRIDEVGELLNMNLEVYTLSINLKTNKNEWKLITDFGMTDDNAELYEVCDVDSNKTIKCTANHKFLTQRGWIECKDLLTTDELFINKQFMTNI